MACGSQFNGLLVGDRTLGAAYQIGNVTWFQPRDTAQFTLQMLEFYPCSNQLSLGARVNLRGFNSLDLATLDPEDIHQDVALKGVRIGVGRRLK